MKQQIKNAIMNRAKKDREQKSEAASNIQITENTKVLFPPKYAINPNNIDDAVMTLIKDNSCDTVEVVFTETEESTLLDKFINNQNAFKNFEIVITIFSESFGDTKHQIILNIDDVKGVNLPMFGNEADNMVFSVRFNVSKVSYKNLSISEFKLESHGRVGISSVNPVAALNVKSDSEYLIDLDKENSEVEIQGNINMANNNPNFKLDVLPTKTNEDLEEFKVENTIKATPVKKTTRKTTKKKTQENNE